MRPRRRPLNRSAQGEHGFTLVEVMTVLVIIGLISGVVILNFPQPKTELDEGANNLLTRVNVAAQNAVISGRVAALGVSGTGYSLYDHQAGEWALTFSEDWPAGVRISLEKNGRNVKLPDEDIPVILFEPTGLSDTFSVNLIEGGGQHFELSSAGDGRAVLKPVL